MDTSGNMDSLDESSALPELSFDDLLDPSPIKKANKPNYDDEALEHDSDRKKYTDDTLNTPGSKKPPVIRRNTGNPITLSSFPKISVPVRTQAVKLGNNPSTLTNVIKNNNGGSSSPILLNSKNILPKTSQILNNSIKFTQKVVGGNGSTASLAATGKTAVRTSNGQIIYIQKTPPTSNIKTTATTTVVKAQNISTTNSKPVTIQVLRTADGNYVPLKTTTSSGTNVKTTLTLSPSTLAGKKIISTSGGQVIIKGTIKPTDSTATSSIAKTITTNAISGVKTVVKPVTTSSLATSQINDLNKPKPIVFHGTGGKQIIVSNQNIVKLSPKPPTTTATAEGSSVTTPTTTSGQFHAIQIPGKLGVQYVRVLPNTKTPAKPLNTSTTTTTTVTSTMPSGPARTVNPSNQPMKILNALPQKFTVLQKGGTTKLVVTQKKDMSSDNNSTEISPATSKLQKTIVTVPTIKSLNDDKNKNPQTQLQQQPSMKSMQPQPSSLSNNSTGNQFLVRKHKISEINSEIHRITTSTDNVGQPEMKKLAPNNRVVVVSNNSQPKVLNNNLQQTGRITSSISMSSSTATATKSVSGSMMQVVNVTQNGKKLYTVLKPPHLEQKANPEMYSMLKTNNQTATTSAIATATSKNIGKPLINKQQLVHQQQKFIQLKQQNYTSENTNKNAKTTSSSTYLLPIKIKEEPVDINTETSAIQLNLLNLPAPAAEEEVDTLENLVGGVRRKHCNCSKSQCLKLYCDCFANGEFCQDCTCKDCFNNLENEDERQRAIKACLERNPNAFKPKITSSRDQADMRLHNKGCNCKRSGCLKNYCECFEAKIPCSSNCKCVGCRNVEDRPDLDMDPVDPKIMATIAMGGGGNDNMSLKRSYDKSQRDFAVSGQGINIKTEKFSKDPLKTLGSYDTLAVDTSPSLESQQCNFITQEVIDATIQCMITQADECEKNSLPAYQTEKMVMEELGRCLVEIIDFSIRNTDNSYSQD